MLRNLCRMLPLYLKSWKSIAKTNGIHKECFEMLLQPMGMHGNSWLSIAKCQECLRMADNLDRMPGNYSKSHENLSLFIGIL
jgi:hypothetical protein